MPTFRPLTRSELDTLLSWAAAEGWNPSPSDAHAFYAADPEGFHAMEHEGRLIGGASTVVYDGRIGFVGLFIVRPEWRGRGWGLAFWRYFIAEMKRRIGPSGRAALDGVFQMQEKYAQSGFVFSHRNLRMEGTGVASPLPPQIVPAASLPFQSLLAFDTAHFGAPREAFLRRWVTPEEGSALALQEGDALKGYGVVRRCERGFKVGPLFAETPEAADTLFAALSAKAANAPLFLDIPENNPAALALAQKHGLQEVFGCARMTLGQFPTLPWGRIYGVTTFELG